MASIIPSSTPSTPKRKHSEVSEGGKPLPALNTVQFSFDLNAPIEDGSNSPRTRVAHKFRGLTIDSGSGVARGADHRSLVTSTSTQNSTPDGADEEMRDGDDDDYFSRKRIKRPDKPDTLAGAQVNGFKMPAEQPTGEWADGLRARLDPAIVRSSKTANRSQRNSSKDSKSRRRRSGTPPLTPFIKPKTSAAAPGEAVAAVTSTGADPTTKPDGAGDNSIQTSAAEDDENPDIVEPIRAALTWHEDEITIYDPDDEDDDGIGINGIGFKPTATIAYTRLVRRKQQIAEYKKREEQEARALRKERRRRASDARVPAVEESPTAAAEAAARRVHFMDVEPVKVMTT